MSDLHINKIFFSHLILTLSHYMAAILINGPENLYKTMVTDFGPSRVTMRRTKSDSAANDSVPSEERQRVMRQCTKRRATTRHATMRHATMSQAMVRPKHTVA